MRRGSQEVRSESGFSLIELLIVTLLLPMIVGSMTMAIMVALAVQSSVTSRIASTGDAQIVSSVFYQDVQGTSMITTSAAAAECGSGTQLLGLEWGLTVSLPPMYRDVASYVVVQTGTTYSLVRNYCASGFSTTPTASTTVAHNISAAQSAPTVTPSGFGAGTGWVSAQGITNVTWTITEQNSGYSYVLAGTPSVSGSSSGG